MASQEANGQGISAGKSRSLYIHQKAVTDSSFADEIALYDRQIRLWGVTAQEKYETSTAVSLLTTNRNFTD
jgi:hypothetical protein